MVGNPKFPTFPDYQTVLWGYCGAGRGKLKKGVYDFHRKPLKFLVELKRIELLAS